MQEVWKVSTTAGTKRVKKGTSIHEASSSSHSTKEPEMPTKSSSSILPFTFAASQSSVPPDSAQVSFHLFLLKTVLLGTRCRGHVTQMQLHERMI